MALSSRAANKYMAAFNEALTNIGNSAGMNMPRSDSNNARVAWDYHVARHVLRMAIKRREETEEAAIRAGILPDTEKEVMPAGPPKIYYTGDHIITMVEVRRPSERVNVDDFMRSLAKKGVSDTLLREAKKEATRTTRPAYMFSTIWNEETGNGK